MYACLLEPGWTPFHPCSVPYLQDGTTPLFHAAQKGHAAVVKLLLTHPRVDVNMANRVSLYCSSWDITVDIYARPSRFRLHRHLSVATLQDGTTPLIMAASEGHTAVVGLLLADPRVDINKGRVSVGIVNVASACTLTACLSHPRTLTPHPISQSLAPGSTRLFSKIPVAEWVVSAFYGGLFWPRSRRGPLPRRPSRGRQQGHASEWALSSYIERTHAARPA